MDRLKRQSHREIILKLAIRLIIITLLLSAQLLWLNSQTTQAAPVAPTLSIVVNTDGDLTGRTCGFGGPSVGCSLRSAIEIANASSDGDPITITFDSDYTIGIIDGDLPTITADNLTIDGTPHQPLINGDGNNIGLKIEGDDVTINNVEMLGFAGPYIQVAAGAQGAAISNNYLDVSPCAPAGSSNTIGIHVVGDLFATVTKATMWSNTVRCMNVAGIKLDNTARVSVGYQKGSNVSHPSNRNILFGNRIGLETIRSCHITEVQTVAQGSIEEGLRLQFLQNCRSNSFIGTTASYNGGVGIRKVMGLDGSVTHANIRPYDVRENGDVPIIIELHGVFTPVPQSYDAATNTLRFQVSTDTDRVYLYELASDPTASGGGGKFVAEFAYNGGITSYPVYLDNYPTLNATNTVLIAGETSPSSKRTSQMSAPYVMSNPTAAALSAQQTTAPLSAASVMLGMGMLLLLSGWIIVKRHTS